MADFNAGAQGDIENTAGTPRVSVWKSRGVDLNCRARILEHNAIRPFGALILIRYEIWVFAAHLQILFGCFI
jgi:hypothetical protein